MKLYVMRHGSAVDDAPSGRDEDRALTKSGRSRVREVAEALVKDGEAPRLIVSSPLVRALQTAEIVAALGHVDTKGEGVDVRRELAPGGQALRLVSDLWERGAKGVMVVGHEPDLSTLVGRLLAQAMPVAMAKAMVVGLHVTGSDRPTASLRFILDPKTLVWEHDARS